MRRRPGEGERNALAGFVPQYKIFAAEILRALHRRALVAVSIADPEAGRLDDIQVELADRIDAFQVKWSSTGDPVTPSDFRDLLRDMITGREAIHSRRGMRVVAHAHTNRPCSTAAFRNQPAELRGASLTEFIEEVWRPATHARFDGPDALPERWRSFFRSLADDVNVTPEELLELAPQVLFEFDQILPEDAVAVDREGELYLEDLHALTRTLFDIASGADRSVVRIETDDLLHRVGGDWPERGRFRAGGTFPPPEDYEEIPASTAALATALSTHSSGYIFVLGSPGSGKSTLLTRTLRNDDRLVASYFAYLPGDNTATRSEASTFLHDLVLTLEERGFRHGGTRPPFTDVDLLQERLRAQLVDVAAEARTRSGIAVILVDGLDHVGRDPAPARSLLQYLPAPESLPDGVLFVIGTRTADDLPSHVRPAVRQMDRVIVVERLPRRAVLEIAERRSLGSLSDEIWRLSGGHPLLMWTFIRLAASLAEDERRSRLAHMTPADGDVTALYEQLWLDIRRDEHLVELFALTARIRVPFTLSWLEETGTPATAARRLDHFPHLIDVDDFRRWSFFHDSFRVFVRERTAERGGAYDPSIDRRLHTDLAARCARADRGDPVAWEEIHHRLAAGDYEGVIECSTPDFFRTQLSALRPTSDVLAAIREAAQAVEFVHDGNAIARLALSATEAQSRGYNLPTGTNLLIALADLGRVQVALSQLDDIRDNVVGNDRRASALEFALHLYDSGNTRAALRIFETYEPLDFFGGPRGDRREAPDGPWKALHAWAEAATVLRSPDYVLRQIDRLDVPPDRFERGDPGEALRRGRAHLLLTAANTAAQRDLNQAAFLEALYRTVEAGDEAWVDGRCLELLHTRDDDNRSQLQAELARLDVTELAPSTGIDVVEVLWRTGDDAAARVKLCELRQPSTPSSASLHEDRGVWNDLYRFLRAKSALDHPLEPTDAIPRSDQSHREEAVYVARHLAAFAALEGAALAGRPLTTGEVTAVAERFLAFWDGRAQSIGMSGLRIVRRMLLSAAVRIANRISHETVRDLFNSFQRRWDAAPYALRRDGWDLLQAFSRAGIGDVSIAQRLEQIEQLDDLDLEEWLEHVLAWIELNRTDRAERAMTRVVDDSFAVGYRKDYQLSEWIPLLRPKLNADGGDLYFTWLGERLVALDDQLEGGATHHAGKILVGLRAETSLGAARRLARVLESGGVFDVDDVVMTLLEASADSGEHAWWLALRELLCPLGVGPPRGIDRAVTAVNTDVDLIRELQQTLERVAIEGRPSLRVRWRSAIKDAAATVGIAGNQIGITDSELEYSDESPSPEWQSTTTDDQREDLPRSFEEMLDLLERGDTDYRLRSAILASVTDAQEALVDRLLAAVSGTDDEARVLAAIARRRYERGDTDEAWSAARAVLTGGTARDWSRSWGGGPVLDAIAILKEIDPEQARPRVFARFAALASQDQFLLTEVGREIGKYVEVFAPLDYDELAQDVLDYLEELLGSPQSGAGEGDTAPEDGGSSTTINDVVRGLAVELLASPYKLAWTCAQRAALALHRSSAPSEPLLTAAFDDPGVPAGRVLALAEAEITEGRTLDERVIERIDALARSPRLDEREAAGRILDRCGRERPALPGRPLPSGLRLELPTRIGTSESVVDSIGRSVQEILELHEHEISTLASLARVDEDALRERVLRRAIELRALTAPDRADRLLGWAYVRPAARSVFTALAEVAAEIVDAGIVPSRAACRALDLGALYDLHLLLTRPRRRPTAVVAAIPESERKPYIDGDWLGGLTGADARLSRLVDGWHVLGESTLVRQLERQLPEERRHQGLTLDADHRIPFLRSHVTAQDLHQTDPRINGALLVRGTYRPIESEQEWLALNPSAATDAGLVANREDPLGWNLGGAPAVRSVWWRSGFAYWDASSAHDEVGEGWLVLATTDAIARLRDAFPEASIAWSVTRTWRPREEGEVSETRSGTLSI